MSRKWGQRFIDNYLLLKNVSQVVTVAMPTRVLDSDADVIAGPLVVGSRRCPLSEYIPSRSCILLTT